MRARPYLVIVRAGEKSLHRNWLGENRNWDLIVSWYGDQTYEPVADETVIAIKGGAGDGLFKTFKALPELIDRYEYFWLPDDDIEADCTSISRLFEITAQHHLELSQPALTHNSYFTHPHTLVCPSFSLRYTTFIEVMAPCLSRGRLKSVLPLFRDHASLFGVDAIWARLDADNRCKAAIIDAVQVRHTRPIGTFLMPILMASGDDPAGKMNRILSEYGIFRVDKSFKCYAGLSRNGRQHRGALKTRLHMFWDYFGQIPPWVQQKAFFSILRKFRFRTTELSQLVAVARDTSQDAGSPHLE